MKYLVIGYGSIGVRHARILSELGNDVAVISKQDIDYPIKYKDISEAIKNENPEYIIIANPTNEHYDTFLQIAQNSFTGIVLVEKPLFCEPREIPKNHFKHVFVAYNLRFHPIIQKLRELLNNKRIISAQIYVGQYLPTWRPRSDYRLHYSSHKAKGGGVLRDLSHELDYANWLFGEWKSVVAIGGHYSHLEIDSEDVFNLTLITDNCPIVNIQLNYLDRVSRREIIINTDQITIIADLIQNTLQINHQVIKYEAELDLTYHLQHQAIINKSYDNLCTLNEGIEVLNLIIAAEKSNVQREWVNR